MEQTALEKEIQIALEAKKYAVLEQLALQYTQFFPLVASGYYYLGLCNFQLKRFNEAKENLDKALSFDENEQKTLFLMAETLMQLNEIKAAGEIYEKLAQDPSIKDNLEVVIALSSFYLRHDQYEAALQQANKACKLGPTNAAAFLQTSYVFAYASNYKMALGAISKAASLEPNNLMIQLQYIDICKKSNHLEMAIAAFEKIKEIQPNNSSLLLEYIELLIQTQKLEEAQKVLAHLALVEGDNVGTLKIKAKIAFELKEYIQCAKICASILVFDNKDLNTYILAAQAYAEAYEYEAAIAVLNEGLEIDNLYNKELLNIKRAELYLKVYDYLRAEKDYRLASQSGSFKGEAYLGLGKFFLQQGKNLEAFFALRSAQQNSVYEAVALIEEHCQNELKMEAQEADHELIEAYAEHFEENSNSPLLKEICASYWRFDEQATLKKNPEIFKALPAEMSKTIIEAFASILVMIKPQGILMLNPKDKDMRGIYKILKEDKNKIQIEVALLGSDTIREFTFVKYPKFLAIDGFAEDVSFELIFSATTLTAEDKTTFNQRKTEGLLAYMNTSKA